jgi:hypothetical protein
MNRTEFFLKTNGRRLPWLSKTILIQGDGMDRFKSAEKLIALLRSRSTIHRIVLTSHRRDVCAALERYFPNDFVVPAPCDRVRAVERFFVRLSPQAIVLLGDAAGLPDLARDHAMKVGVPVATVEGRIDELQTLEPVLPLPVIEAPPKEGWWRDGLVPRLSRTALGGVLVKALSTGGITSLEELRKHLGNPASIMCLGNGPSSESPRLEELECDCLFRVNWIWKGRGYFERPDLVFVGAFETVRRVTGCIFGFRNSETEAAVLLESLLRPRRVPLKYINLENIPTILEGMALKARPSGGALIVLIAAALQPDRLVISGVDLFQHPDGRYPGDNTVVNEYAQPHHREVDIEVIAKSLAMYRGDLTILSDRLREAVERRVSTA